MLHCCLLWFLAAHPHRGAASHAGPEAHACEGQARADQVLPTRLRQTPCSASEANPNCQRSPMFQPSLVTTDRRLNQQQWNIAQIALLNT
jgi:hypothetical protein